MNNRSRKILIFGATSVIISETAKLFARDGASLYLCARSKDDLQRLAADLKVRGAKDVFYSTFDALKEDSLDNAIQECLAKFPDLNGLLIGHGVLPNQRQCEERAGDMRTALEVNFTSIAEILIRITPHFEQQGYGTIAVISSLAGDRGRQSNYIYGSAKSALSTFLSGLRQRLHKSSVQVITIKPGFVDTPMTKDFKKGILWASPVRIGQGIYKAFESGIPIVYVPGFWRLIILVIRFIPESLFKRLKL